MFSFQGHLLGALWVFSFPAQSPQPCLPSPLPAWARLAPVDREWVLGWQRGSSIVAQPSAIQSWIFGLTVLSPLLTDTSVLRPLSSPCWGRSPILQESSSFLCHSPPSVTCARSGWWVVSLSFTPRRPGDHLPVESTLSQNAAAQRSQWLPGSPSLLQSEVCVSICGSYKNSH